MVNFCDYVKKTGEICNKKCGRVNNYKQCYIHRIGGDLCIHNKRKRLCKQCDGSGLCVHKIQKGKCKTCKGKNICPHNKQREYCKECGGNQICVHNRQKSSCKDCKGSQICEHNNQKSRCKECKGSQICKHGIDKAFCKECGGSQICEHNKRKQYCIECCDPKNLCKHEKIRNNCVICANKKCVHGVVKYNCKDCKGTNVCKHDLLKYCCRICDIDVHPHNWCSLCKYVNIKQSNYKPYCFYCHCILHPDKKISRRYKLKEHYLKDLILLKFPDINAIFDKVVNGGCSQRRPDILIDRLTHSIIIECDEYQHSGIIKECENYRISLLFKDLGDRPMVVLRFNPDNYKNKYGKLVKGCFTKTTKADNSIQKKEWERRTTKLFKYISFYIDNIPNKEFTINYLFYTKEKIIDYTNDIKI